MDSCGPSSETTTCPAANTAVGGEQTQQQTTAPSTTSDEPKIEILFKNTGNAPIMKKTKWSVKTSSTVSGIVDFITKYLKLDPTSQSLFLYVNQSFAPALDQTVQNLFDCYECDKKLVLYYATTQAWGWAHSHFAKISLFLLRNG